MLRTLKRACAGRSVVAMAAGGLVVLGGPSLSLAQQGEKTNEAKTLFAFEFAGMGALTQDERDAGLARALSMLPERLKEMKRSPEMAREFGHVPDEAIDLVWNRLGGPVRIIVTAREGTDPNTGFPLIGAVVSFGMEGEQEAHTLHAHINGLRMQAGDDLPVKESKRFEGMLDAQLPFGALSFGPRNGADGWRYEFLFGAIPHPDRAFNDMPSDAHGETVASMRLDLAALTPYVQPFVAMGLMGMGEQGQEMMTKLREQGIFGPDAMTIEATSSYVGNTAVKRMVMRGVGDNAEALGLPTRPLAADDLAAIPADAIFAHVYQGDMVRQFEQMKMQMGPMGQEVDGFVAMFRDQTGVDLVEDVLKSIGSTGAVYMSHSTGGNSLMSLTMAQRVTDGAKLDGAIAKLADMGNAIAAQNIPTQLVGISADRFERAGALFTQLRVSGAPIPIQPTFAIADGWMMSSVTPQGCLAAVQQKSKGVRHSLMANPVFAERFNELTKLGEPVTLTFWDTRETMNDGYGLMQMGCTALENFVRSPGGDRDPGMVMPTLGDLREGVVPMLSMTYWDGDDYVMHQTSDRSILANLAGALGFADLGPMVAGALAGSGMTATIMENRGDFGAHDWDDEWEEDWHEEEEEPAF